MSAQSHLWTRRMTLTNKTPDRQLAPLLTASSCSSFTSAVTASSPLQATPSCYAPSTEAIKIFLVDSTSSPPYSASDRFTSPSFCSLYQDEIVKPIAVTMATTASDLQCEIDMASLGTEMAMSLFDSESDTSAGSMNLMYAHDVDQCDRVRSKTGKDRLLPFLITSDLSRHTAAAAVMTSRSNTPSSTCTLKTIIDDAKWQAASTPSVSSNTMPNRKGRARMSQEKRRRLARRREREALLLGLQYPTSAPSARFPPLLTPASGSTSSSSSSSLPSLITPRSASYGDGAMSEYARVVFGSTSAVHRYPRSATVPSSYLRSTDLWR